MWRKGRWLSQIQWDTKIKNVWVHTLWVNSNKSTQWTPCVQRWWKNALNIFQLPYRVMLFLCQTLIYSSMEERSICNVKTTAFHFRFKTGWQKYKHCINPYWFLFSFGTRGTKVIRNLEFHFKASTFMLILKV